VPKCSEPGATMTMTSETAQELREGGSSNPRFIKIKVESYEDFKLLNPIYHVIFSNLFTM